METPKHILDGLPREELIRRVKSLERQTEYPGLDLIYFLSCRWLTVSCDEESALCEIVYAPYRSEPVLASGTGSREALMDLRSKLNAMPDHADDE